MSTKNLKKKEEEHIENILKDWLPKFYLKYQKEYEKKPEKFFTNLIKKLKMVLLLEFKEGYWSIIIGKSKRLYMAAEFRKKEKFLEFDLDFQTNKRLKRKIYFI